MAFYENFIFLCKQRNMSPGKVMQELGYTSTGTLTTWKKGTEPNSANQVRIANYFGVSVERLMGDLFGNVPSVMAVKAIDEDADIQWLITMWKRASFDDREVIRTLLRKYDERVVEKQA